MPRSFTWKVGLYFSEAKQKSNMQTADKKIPACAGIFRFERLIT
jgi:hypothetical protein